MKAKLQAGVEVDFLSPKEFKDGLDGVVDKLVKAYGDILFQDLQSAGVADANGQLTLDLGAASTGRFWDVKSVRITVPGDPPVDVAGMFDIYRKEVNPRYWVDGTTTIPAVSPWGKSQFFLKPSENLLVRCNGLVAGQQVIATAMVEDTVWRPGVVATTE